jgi:hypothetical protein
VYIIDRTQGFLQYPFNGFTYSMLGAEAASSVDTRSDPLFPSFLINEQRFNLSSFHWNPPRLCVRGEGGEGDWDPTAPRQRENNTRNRTADLIKNIEKRYKRG